jgi:hypothetical protein
VKTAYEALTLLSFARAVDDIFNKDFVGFEEIENCK